MSESAFGSLSNPGSGTIDYPSGSLEPLWWGLRAFHTEVFGFRFSYPIELTRQTEASPLRYHVYSDRLFFDAMQLDSQGVPFQRSRVLGKFYNPAYVAWYGLMVLEQSLRANKKIPDSFIVQMEWLIQHAIKRDDGAVVWHFPVDVIEGRCKLLAPWISAMTQGLVISLLIRAHRAQLSTLDLMSLCLAGTVVFSKAIDEGGVKSSEAGYSLYEEYPAYPLPRVLDGFLFSLLGLYDCFSVSKSHEVKQLFDDGVAGLVNHLNFWNYSDKWTWYGSHGYLCPPHYHQLNRHLLSALAHATGEVTLAKYAELWNPARLTFVQRTQLFSSFVFLKQWARLKHLGIGR